MSQPTAGETLFSFMKEKFDRSPFYQGTVQFVSHEPAQEFFVEVGPRSLSYGEGVAPKIDATITLRQNLLTELPSVAEEWEPRKAIFNKRISYDGNVKLADELLEFVKRPTATAAAKLRTSEARARERGPLASIERVSHPDKSVIQKAMADFRPLLMGGLLDAWEVSKWSPETLNSALGACSMSPYLPGKLGDFIEAMSGGTAANRFTYINGPPMPHALNEYFPELPLLKDIHEMPLIIAQLWLGYAADPNTPVTRLHADVTDGFLCQVFGRKKLVLYPPTQGELLYPYPAYNFAIRCHAQPEKPDYEMFPRLKEAAAVEVVLEPGDVLFIPAGWYHLVYSLDPVMSISYTYS